MGSVYTGDKCYCAACDVKAGNRTKEDWEKLVKPDYSILFEKKFWLEWTEDEANDKAD